MEQVAEQLEFDLWTEIRVSEFELVSGRAKHLVAEAYYDAYVHGEARVMMLQDPVSMHTIIRYRV